MVLNTQIAEYYSIKFTNLLFLAESQSECNYIKLLIQKFIISGEKKSTVLIGKIYFDKLS